MKGNITVKRLHSNQSGIASIVIAILIIIILSTIVLGFSQVIRREQRRTLDRQLSTQAFYAAESGINDARQALAEGFTAQKNTCAPLAPGPYTSISGTSSNQLDGDNVKYNCLLINPTPVDLQYDNVGTEGVTVVPIEDSGGGSINTITIAWEKASSGASVSTDFRGVGNSFTPAASWGAKTGLLRVEVSPATSLLRSDLINLSRTFFLYPNTDPSSGGNMLDPAGTGTIVNGGCSPGGTPRKCKVVISGLVGQNRTFLRLSSIYQASAVTITATTAAGGAAKLVGAQSIVDSTGVASEVSRRVQVRVANNGGVDVPENVLSSMNTLCKTMSVTLDTTTIPGIPKAVSGTGDANCNIL